MEKLLQWNKSSGGYVTSKCGKYSITPEFCGTTRPQSYALYYTGYAKNKWDSISSGNDTQQIAKDEAEVHAARIEAERKEAHKKFLEEEERTLPDRLRKYRKENFAVRVVPQKATGCIDDIIVEITTNGYQWWNTGLTYEEAQKVIDALQKELDRVLYQGGVK